jgi:hypothetical protein
VTAIAAVFGGLLIGFLVTDRRTAYLIWVPVWVAVLTFQTIVLETTEGGVDWGYPFVQIAIFGVGLAAVWFGGFAPSRSAKPS